MVKKIIILVIIIKIGNWNKLQFKYQKKKKVERKKINKLKLIIYFFFLLIFLDYKLPFLFL